MGHKSIDEKMLEVYRAWDFISKEKARDMLKKMVLQDINESTDIEDKRLIYHNLTTVIMKIGNDMDSARYYSKLLIDMLDSYPNYKEDQTNRERYCRALNNYTDCYKGELSNEELIKIYEFHYETYKNYKYDNDHVDEYREKLISEYNLNMIKKNFTKILMIIEDFCIHNNNTQYEEAIQAILQEVKDINVMLYQNISLMIQENKIQAI